MSKVKYRVREYTPKTENQGSHSWFAEAVIDNDITNNELAKAPHTASAPALEAQKRGHCGLALFPKLDIKFKRSA